LAHNKRRCPSSPPIGVFQARANARGTPCAYLPLGLSHPPPGSLCYWLIHWRHPEGVLRVLTPIPSHQGEGNPVISQYTFTSLIFHANTASCIPAILNDPRCWANVDILEGRAHGIPLQSMPPPPVQSSHPQNYTVPPESLTKPPRSFRGTFGTEHTLNHLHSAHPAYFADQTGRHGGAGGLMSILTSTLLWETIPEAAHKAPFDFLGLINTPTFKRFLDESSLRGNTHSHVRTDTVARADLQPTPSKKCRRFHAFRWLSVL